MKYRFVMILMGLLTTLAGEAHSSIKDSAAKAQRKEARRNKPTAHRYGLWYTPVGVRSTVINGIAIGYVTMGENLRVNGVNVEFNPIAIVYLPYAVIGVISHIVERKLPILDTVNMGTKITTRINGLNIGTLAMDVDNSMNGVNINIIGSDVREMKGLEISGITNMHDDFNGVMAGIVNISRKGKGVQIGVYNYCKSGSVLQIGLINKSGKRIFPFVNLKLKESDNL